MARTILACAAAWAFAAQAGSSANYESFPQVFGSGGGILASASKLSRHTVGEFAVGGSAASANYAVSPGFWRLGFGGFLAAEPQTAQSAALLLTQSVLAPINGNRDIVFTLTVTNQGPAGATGVKLFNPVPPGLTYTWSSPGCATSSGALTCDVGSLAPGASASRHIVLRRLGPINYANIASVTAAQDDPGILDNVSAAIVNLAASPAAQAVLRYRLYSDVTKEHHFTTDLNEYNVLGTYVGTWVQEGTVGKLLDNPGQFGGVQGIPYYRLYDNATRWHHWTTDANEYYTLGFIYSGWNMEGVDGYLLPSNPPGTTQLYRLNYPFLGSLHHWTIDANEYNTLIISYGWVPEPGAGWVVQ